MVADAADLSATRARTLPTIDTVGATATGERVAGAERSGQVSCSSALRTKRTFVDIVR
jgi:hypothetical protein